MLSATAWPVVGSISDTEVTLLAPRVTELDESKLDRERLSCGVLAEAPRLMIPIGARKTPFWLMVSA